MVLEKSLNKIKEFIHGRYKDNLAGLLVFGTVNTGEFIEGKSDIDTMIFLKKLNGLDLKKESKFLFDNLKSEYFANQYFHTLEGIKDYINKRISFSTYLVIIADDGSRVLYSTTEFEKLKNYLKENPPSKDSIKRYLNEKDNFELEGYFKKQNNFVLTKALFAHLRRKLQVMNYFQNNDLIFGYDKCLENINLNDDEKNKLNILYDYYKNREELSSKDVEDYYDLAKKFTSKIMRM